MSRLIPKTGKENGVAILLAVMIVSGITIIVSTVAFFVMQEVRVHRSMLKTEPAITLAESLGEQGIYQYKRSSTAIANCSSNPAYTQADGRTTGGTSSFVRTRNCIKQVAPTLSVLSGSPVTLYIYDTSNVNGNTCMETGTCDADGQGTGTQIYTALVFNYVSGNASTVTYTVTTLDGVAVGSGSLNTVPPNATVGILSNIPAASDERLKVTLTSNGTSTVKVDTRDASNASAGLPDYQTLDAEACVSTTVAIANCDANAELYTRRINITLPTQPTP